MTGVYEEGLRPRTAPGHQYLSGTRGRARHAPGPERGRLDAITLLSLFYVGLLLVWHGLRFTPVGTWPLFEVVDIFGLALFVPLPLLLLLSMLCASRRAGLVLMVPILVLTGSYGSLFLPRAIPSIFRPSSATGD